jgi:hypothetical protein
MSYVIAAKGTGKEMRYDGVKFSERTPRTYSKKASAAKIARELIAKFPILRRYTVSIRPFGQPIKKRAPKGRAKRLGNPSLRDPELARAGKLLEDFSGHAPSEMLRVGEKPFRKGLVIGQLDGVLYTTVRDGKRERYIHKFRKSSRPLLTASADGTQLGIVGGQFQMTEAGIEDR